MKLTEQLINELTDVMHQIDAKNKEYFPSILEITDITFSFSKIKSIIQQAQAGQDPEFAIRVFLETRWNMIANTHLCYTMTTEYPLNWICVQLSTVFSTKGKQVNSILMPNVRMVDLSGNILDDLEFGTFIVQDDKRAFIVLEDLIASAIPRILQQEPRPYVAVNFKNKIVTLSDAELLRTGLDFKAIKTLVDEPNSWFNKLFSRKIYPRGTLGHLVALREALRKGDARHGGTENEVNKITNIGLAAFSDKFYNKLDDKEKAMINKLHSNPPGSNISEGSTFEYVWGYLASLNSRGPHEVRYCTDGLGRKLESIIERNAIALRDSQNLHQAQIDSIQTEMKDATNKLRPLLGKVGISHLNVQEKEWKSLIQNNIGIETNVFEDQSFITRTAHFMVFSTHLIRVYTDQKANQSFSKELEGCYIDLLFAVGFASYEIAHQSAEEQMLVLKELYKRMSMLFRCDRRLEESWRFCLRNSDPLDPSIVSEIDLQLPVKIDINQYTELYPISYHKSIRSPAILQLQAEKKSPPTNDKDQCKIFALGQLPKVRDNIKYYKGSYIFVTQNRALLRDTFVVNGRAVKGLRWKEMPGDGHCLYHSVGLHLHKDVSSLRNEVADYIEARKENYRNICLLQDPGPDEEANFAQYLVQLRTGGAWADHIEIDVLMKLYERPIVIINSDGTLRKNDYKVYLTNDKKPIFVHYESQVHYNGFEYEDAQAQEILKYLETPADLPRVLPVKSQLFYCNYSGHMKHIVVDNMHDFEAALSEKPIFNQEGRLISEDIGVLISKHTNHDQYRNHDRDKSKKVISEIRAVINNQKTAAQRKHFAEFWSDLCSINKSSSLSKPSSLSKLVAFHDKHKESLIAQNAKVEHLEVVNRALQSSQSSAKSWGLEQIKKIDSNQKLEPSNARGRAKIHLERSKNKQSKAEGEVARFKKNKFGMSKPEDKIWSNEVETDLKNRWNNLRTEASIQEPLDLDNFFAMISSRMLLTGGDDYTDGLFDGLLVELMEKSKLSILGRALEEERNYWRCITNGVLALGANPIKIFEEYAKKDTSKDKYQEKPVDGIFPETREAANARAIHPMAPLSQLILANWEQRAVHSDIYYQETGEARLQQACKAIAKFGRKLDVSASEPGILLQESDDTIVLRTKLYSAANSLLYLVFHAEGQKEAGLSPEFLEAHENLNAFAKDCEKAIREQGFVDWLRHVVFDSYEVKALQKDMGNLVVFSNNLKGARFNESAVRDILELESQQETFARRIKESDARAEIEAAGRVAAEERARTEAAARKAADERAETEAAARMASDVKLERNYKTTLLDLIQAKVRTLKSAENPRLELDAICSSYAQKTAEELSYIRSLFLAVLQEHEYKDLLSIFSGEKPVGPGRLGIFGGGSGDEDEATPLLLDEQAHGTRI